MTLEQQYINKKIDRISAKLKRLLLESTDVDFLNIMCYNENEDVAQLVLRNKNLPISTIEDIICFKRYFKESDKKNIEIDAKSKYSVGYYRTMSLLHRGRVEDVLSFGPNQYRVELSTMLKSSEINDYSSWWRCYALKDMIEERFPFLTNMYGLPYKNCKKGTGSRESLKMKVPNSRIHLFR